MTKREIEWFETPDGKRHFIADYLPDRFEELQALLLHNGLVLHEDGSISAREDH